MGARQSTAVLCPRTRARARAAKPEQAATGWRPYLCWEYAVRPCSSTSLNTTGALAGLRPRPGGRPLPGPMAAVPPTTPGAGLPSAVLPSSASLPVASTSCTSSPLVLPLAEGLPAVRSSPDRATVRLEGSRRLPTAGAAPRRELRRRAACRAARLPCLSDSTAALTAGQLAAPSVMGAGSRWLGRGGAGCGNGNGTGKSSGINAGGTRSTTCSPAGCMGSNWRSAG